MAIPTNPVILSADAYSFITAADKSTMRERLGAPTYDTTYYVKTWAQLLAALGSCGSNGGGIIYIDGTIVIPPNFTTGFTGNGGLNITVPNVIITGYPNGKSVLKLQAGATYTNQILSVININASNVTIENITIEGVIVRYIFNAANILTYTSGIHFARGGNSTGISDITIRNTHIFNTLYAIFQTGGPGSPINREISITSNKIRTSGYGLYLEQSIEGCLIADNSIVGDGALYDGTKYSYGNCIWVGYGIHRCRIINNHCSEHQRMGIEVFWPFRNTYDSANQNPSLASRDTSDAGVVVANNTITNCGSMGISFAGARGSVVANNTISDVVFVGLELVGDDKNSNTQVPDRILNVGAFGNMIKNVRATPRRPTNTTPTINWPFGFENSALQPSNCSLTTQQFRNKVALTEAQPYTVGSKTFTFTSPGTYNEFAIGKQAKLQRTDNIARYMIGTVTANTGTTITINITEVAVASDGTSYNYTICPHGLHTIGISSGATTPLIWSGHSGTMASLSGIPASGTNVFIRHPTTREHWLQGRVESYTLSATTASVYITNNSSSAFDNSTWIAMHAQMCVGLSIDQIDGCKVEGNTIDTVLDSSEGQRFGCQIYKSNNVNFENNTLTRAGKRYLFINSSNNVVVANNEFRSGAVAMVRDATTQNITVMGEDILYPENPLTSGGQPYPASIYAIFTSEAPEYSSTAFYNNCKIIVRDNTITPSINPLHIYSNGAPLFSHPNARPERQFGPAIVFKYNSYSNGYAIPTQWDCPVLDYSQKWNNSAQDFTAYRFNVDTGLAGSGANSRVFDISVGDENYVLDLTYRSTTENTLSAAFQSKTWTLGSTVTLPIPGPVYVPLSATPIGTFVRCTGSNRDNATITEGYVEGRITGLGPSANQFTIQASNAQTFGAGSLTSSLTSWSVQFDPSALFIDKFAQLNLRSNVVLDYHTGTKFGTSSAQKLSFWNRTPVIQPDAVAKATDATSVIAQLNTLIDRLSSIGILAS